MEHSAVLDRSEHDYEADEMLVVSDREGLRALANDLRSKIVVRLRDRARSITELADELGLPKGTVGHHVKVLEKAGLVRVVRTRKVRALTESYYGRTARLFVIKSEEYPDEARDFVAGGLRIAAEELRPPVEDEESTSAYVHAHLTPEDARRFTRRLEKLLDDFQAADTPEGTAYGIVYALYPAGAPRG
jgi:DNA-binding transcriptional ArsR family regulator